MKRIVSIGLALMLLLSLLAGCDTQEPPVVPETTEATQAPTEAPTQEATEEVTEEVTQQLDNSDPMADGSLKILAIGNSFTDDTMEYVDDVAIALGMDKFVLSNLYIGGASIDDHVRKLRIDSPSYEYRRRINGKYINESCTQMSFALQDENWDYVVLQQQSLESGNPASFALLTELIDYVHEHAPQAKLIWNMTWAYADRYEAAEFAKYGYNNNLMYKAIIDTAQKVIVPDERVSMLVPTGTAVQNARTSFLGTDLTRDGYHMDMGVGRYILALTFMGVVLGEPIEEISFAPDGVTSDMKKVAIESARNALAIPFEVTESAHKEQSDA